MSSRVLGCANGSDSDAILRDKKHRRRPGFIGEDYKFSFGHIQIEGIFFYKACSIECAFQDS